MPRPNWSRPLPQPLVIPDVMTLTTLADVRELLRHVPKERRALHTWRYVADQLEAAARGDVEAVHVSVALRMALSMEHVQCLPA